jgi:hypothetical protein
MTRITALVVVMVIAGGQASEITCGLVCAASAAVSDRAGGCHADLDDATGLRVTPVSTPCDHAAVGPWLSEVGQPAPKSVITATVLIADAVRTNAAPTESTNSLRRSTPESPPPLGSVRPSILRI